MEQIQLSVEEFIACKDNPIQRDTVAHALGRSAAGGHLSSANPTHAKVSLARIKNSGSLYKLDGHSRAYLWKIGELEEPPLLYADVYEVGNVAEAIELYKTFDSDTAVERPRDKLYGAFRYHKFSPRHGFMYQATGVITAMKLCIHPTKWGDAKLLSMYDLVEPWIDTFKLIDRLEPFNNHFIFPSYITMAMMVTIQRDKDVALSFWQSYHDAEGTHSKTSESPYFTARNMQRDLKAAKHITGGHGHGFIRTTVPTFVYLYDQWALSKRIPNKLNMHSKKFQQTLPNVSEWWRDNIGDYFYPQIRQQQELDIAE
jgi:hypothetical protein